MFHTRFLAAASALALIAGPALALPAYTITELPPLPGDQVNYAEAINNAGQVVGTSENGSTGSSRAFLWDSTNGLQDLNEIMGSNGSRAHEINNAGQVVGQVWGGSLWLSALWDSTNGLQHMDGLTGLSYFDNHDINDAGQILGRSWEDTSWKPVLWDSTNGLQYMDAITGLSGFHGYDINNAGQILGGVWVPAGATTHEYLWTPGTGLTDITYTAHKQDGGWAYDLNDAGQVVGQIWDGTGVFAYLWDPVDGFVSLGAPAGHSASGAYAINNLGQVVGESNGNPTGNAFLWDAVNGMQNLNDLIDPLAGLHLHDGSDINDAGQIISHGWYMSDPTVERVFLLTPTAATPAVPLPAGGLLLLSGLAVLARRRRKAA